MSIYPTMPILVAKACKPKADSKLGFTYSTVNGCTTITSVNDEGLFGGTGLKAGQSVLTINGSRAGDIGGGAMMKLLEPLGEGEVTIVVENPPGVGEEAIFDYHNCCSKQKNSEGHCSRQSDYGNIMSAGFG